MVYKVVYNYLAKRAEGSTPSLITITRIKKLCSEYNYSLEDINIFKRLEALI